MTVAGEYHNGTAAPPDLCEGRVAVPIAVLVIGHIIGFSGTSAVPLWLGTLSSFANVRGWVASAEILLVGVGSLVAAAFASRLGARRTCVWGAALALAGNLLSMAPYVSAFVAGRCVAGFTLGAVLASVSALAAERDDAQKAFSAMFFGQAAFTAIFYFVVPELMVGLGERTVFAVLALTTLLGGIVLWRYIPGRGPVQARRARFRPVPRAIVMLLGVGALFVGQSMAWISLFTIARVNGFDDILTSRIMAFASIGMMAGPLIAGLTGSRLGLRGPIIAFAVLLSFDVAIITHLDTVVPFAAAAAGLVLLPAFGLPFATALVGREGSAEHAGVMPAVITFGSAIGPALAAPLLLVDGPMFAVVGGTICVSGTLALCVAMMIHRAPTSTNSPG